MHVPTISSDDNLLDLPGHPRLTKTKAHYSPHGVTQGEETTLGEHMRKDSGCIWFSNYMRMEEDDDSVFLHSVLAPEHLPGFLKQGNLLEPLTLMKTKGDLPDSLKITDSFLLVLTVL